MPLPAYYKDKKGGSVAAIVAPIVAAAAPSLIEKFINFVTPVKSPAGNSCPPPPGYFNDSCPAGMTGHEDKYSNRWFYREGVDPEEWKDLKTDKTHDEMKEIRERYLQEKEEAMEEYDMDGRGVGFKGPMLMANGKCGKGKKSKRKCCKRCH